MRTRRIVILGATGSIGKSARKVARDIPDRMEISGLSAHFDCEGLAQAASEFPRAKTALSSGPDGEQRLIDLATLPEADMVLIAIVGTAGLKPALAAIEAGKDLAVASKEILVMAGEIVMAAAARKGVNVLPVDSEHNAIFQCLDGRAGTALQRIILTCSGRSVSRNATRRTRSRDAGDGAKASHLVDGPQNFNRFGDALQQGPRDD